MDLMSPWLLDAVTLLQVAFTIWMLVDCYRRGAEWYWFWIILLVPVVGTLAYFFAVKLVDYTARGGTSPLAGLWARMTRPSLEELRFRAQQTPTFASHVALAERLVERGLYAEAVPHLEAALNWESEHGQVLYWLAQCRLQLGEPEAAIALLERILNRDRHWQNGAAWYLLIEAKQAKGDGAGALATSRELVAFSPILHHRCVLAEQLLANGQHEEARALLDESLTEYRFASASIRRRNRTWASKAQRLRKQAE